MWKGVHLNQNKYLRAQRTSRALLRGGGRARDPRRQPAAPSGLGRPWGASQRSPGIVFLQLGQKRAGGGLGSTKAPPPPVPGARSRGPAAGSQPTPVWRLYFLWLSGALLIIYFFSLCFIFIFKLPAGLDAVHSPRCLGARRADSRSRLGLSPAARRPPAPGEGAASREWGSAGKGGALRRRGGGGGGVGQAPLLRQGGAQDLAGGKLLSREDDSNLG